MKTSVIVVLALVLLALAGMAMLALRSLGTVVVPNLLSPGQQLLGDLVTWGEERIGIR